jgi:TPP-dependent pyruvate/acetoin dehydrogenase alpha subunit
MRAFVTTRLIDHYEQLVFQQGELEKARLLPFAALVLGQQAGMLGQELSSMHYLLSSAISDKDIIIALHRSSGLCHAPSDAGAS